MRRKIPREVFVFGVLAALFVAFYVLGTLAPKSAAQVADQKLRTAVGQIPVPDITGTMVDGRPFRLSDYRGKVVLLNFWATWCGPCRQEIPDLIKLQKDFGPQGFTVVGLSEDDDMTPVVPFVKQEGMNYPVLISPPGVANQLQITGLPTSFLIGRDGKFVYMTPGVFPDRSMYDVWSDEIRKVL